MAAIAVAVAFPPWETCVDIGAGGCKLTPPYGWDFYLSLVGDSGRRINRFLLGLEVVLIIVIFGYVDQHYSERQEAEEGISVPSLPAQVAEALGRTLILVVVACVLLAWWLFSRG